VAAADLTAAKLTLQTRAGSDLSGLDRVDRWTQAFLTAIFFSLFCACCVFGSVTVSTPFLKFASIFSSSTPSGTPNDR
jgi:hypothetical protein